MAPALEISPSRGPKELDGQSPRSSSSLQYAPVKPSIISRLISRIVPKPYGDPKVIAEMTSTMIDPYGSAGYHAFTIVFSCFVLAIMGVLSLLCFSLAVNLTGYIILGTFVVVSFHVHLMSPHADVFTVVSPHPGQDRASSLEGPRLHRSKRVDVWPRHH